MPKLSDLLDHIGQNSAPRREVAKDLLKALSPGDKLKLVALDLSTLLQKLPQQIDIRGEVGEVELTFPQDVLLVKRVDCSLPHTISYADDPDCFQVFGEYFDSSQRHVRSLENALIGAQIARDHADSVLLLPSEMREKRFLEWQSDSGLSVSELTFQAAFVRQLEWSIG